MTRHSSLIYWCMTWFLLLAIILLAFRLYSEGLENEQRCQERHGSLLEKEKALKEELQFRQSLLALSACEAKDRWEKRPIKP